jgi:hypothetical protein
VAAMTFATCFFSIGEATEAYYSVYTEVRLRVPLNFVPQPSDIR